MIGSVGDDGDHNRAKKRVNIGQFTRTTYLQEGYNVHFMLKDVVSGAVELCCIMERLVSVSTTLIDVKCFRQSDTVETVFSISTTCSITTARYTICDSRHE